MNLLNLISKWNASRSSGKPVAGSKFRARRRRHLRGRRAGFTQIGTVVLSSFLLLGPSICACPVAMSSAEQPRLALDAHACCPDPQSAERRDRDNSRHDGSCLHCFAAPRSSEQPLRATIVRSVEQAPEPVSLIVAPVAPLRTALAGFVLARPWQDARSFTPERLGVSLLI